MKLGCPSRRRRRIRDIFGSFQSTDYLYNRRGPWPQPAPDHPHGAMAGAVLRVPAAEQADWDKHVGRRYFRQLLTYWPTATALSRTTSTLAPMRDARFVALLTDSLMSMFVTPGLDARSAQTFRAQVERAPDAEWLTLDLSPMGAIRPFEGVYVAPTLTLFKRCGCGQLEVTAIAINGILLEPDHGDAWELAKYFVLQGAGVSITLLKHPISHFPVDAINAITKTSLPKGHPILRLIHPHCRLQLPVNGAVLHGASTVLRQRERHPYAPYPGSFRDNLKLVSLGWTGIDGNRTYRPYRYPTEPPRYVSDYSRYLWAYWEAFLDYVTRVLDHARFDRAEVEQWADDIARWVPGFPDGRVIFDDDRLARAVAMFMWTVSVQHCAEHYLYSQMRLDEVPMRLRVPPPPSPQWQGLDRSRLVTMADQFAYAMCMKMFFANHCIASLRDVDYGFDDPVLDGLSQDFTHELAQIDATLRREGVKNMVPLDEIAVSIQY